MQIDEENSWSDEEWQEIKKKFEKEGVDPHVSVNQKALYMWRWLVDSEENLSTSRKMLEKLREQQSDEMKEVETYVEHIRNLSREKVEKLEKENLALAHELDELRSKSVERIIREVNEMLTQEGLTEVLNSTIPEQVAYLLVLKSRLTEELEMEKNKNSNISANLTDNLKLTSSQFQQMLEEQKSDFEEELRHQRELTKEVKEELKRTHDLEVSQLQLKLATTKKRVTELEELLNTKNSSRRNSKDSYDEEKDAIEIKRFHEKLITMEERIKKLDQVKRQLEIDNESLTYKVSELLVECEEKDANLRMERMRNVGIKPCNRQMSITESPKRRLSVFDNLNMISQQEASWMQQVKKLQQEVDNLQEQLVSAGGKQENLAIRYQRRKSEGRTKMQKLKDVFHAKQGTLKDQITDLDSALTVVQTSLSWEKECRQKIQSDFASLQKEKADLTQRLIESEEALREKTIQLKSVNLRLDNLEKENARVCQEMSLLKKLVLKKSLGTANSQAQESNNKPTSSQWLQKLQLSPEERKRFSKLEKMLVPASVDQKEITV